MRKTILLSAAILLLLAGCNQTHDKPDAERVIKDTVANLLLKDFNQAPAQTNINVTVHPKEESTPRVQQPEITAFLQQLKSKPQHFTINPAQPVNITGAGGTTIAFNANTFIDNDGKPVADNVDVELKEIYTLPDMLTENVVSVSNGQLLQRKAAISVNAFYKGQPLKLATGQNMRVSFPFALKGNDGYRFYYGTESHNQVALWQPAENDRTTDAATQGRKVSPPQFGYGQLGLKQYLNTILQYPEDARRNELSARVEAQFRIDKNGKVVDVTTTGATYKTFKDEITRVLMNMPVWTAAQYNDRDIASSMKVTIDFNLRRSEQIKVDANESDLTFYTEKRNHEYAFGLNNIPAEPVYERNFSSLGWIACDRPIDVAKPADVIVQADGYTEVKAILKSTNTIVSGENCVGYTRFKNLPLNTDITLLSIRHINGETSYALLPLKTQKQNVISPVWIKADDDDLAALLKGLINT